MDVSRLRQGEKIAAIAGLALLVFMFLPWYGLDGQFGQIGEQLGVDTSIDAWGAFGGTDLLLFLIAAVAIALAVLTATQNAPALPVSASVITTGAGGLGALLVLYRIVNQPGPNDVIGVKFGVFLGLLACLGIAYGGFKALQDENTPGIPSPEPELRPAPPAAPPTPSAPPGAAAVAATPPVAAADPPQASFADSPAADPPTASFADSPAADPPQAGFADSPAAEPPRSGFADSPAAEPPPAGFADSPAAEPHVGEPPAAISEPAPAFGADEPDDRPPGAA
jgi:hypothetical protein